jgi:hypothetical protein
MEKSVRKERKDEAKEKLKTQMLKVERMLRVVC